LGLFVCSTVVTFMAAWRKAAARELSLVIFFLIYGMTEPVISGPVSLPLIIMFLAIAMIQSGSLQRSATGAIEGHASSAARC
jgi:hypothetical protein